jgi:tellurite resistance protein
VSNSNLKSRLKQFERKAARADAMDNDLLKAVVTASALVAMADGQIKPHEREAFIDFMDRNGFMAASTRGAILSAFDRRVSELDEEGGARAAVDDFERFAGRSPARVVLDAGKIIALSDGALHEGEIHFLQLIHIALLAPYGRGFNSVGAPR